MKKVNVYIYTTVKSPRKKRGAYVYLLEADTSKGAATRFDVQPLENVTANQAGLDALAAALKRIYKCCSLIIYMDSAHIAACAEKWLEKWRKDGWKNAKGRQVANMEEWEELAHLLDVHNCQFVIGAKHPYYEWMKAEAGKAERNVSCRDDKRTS